MVLIVIRSHVARFTLSILVILWFSGTVCAHSHKMSQLTPQSFHNCPNTVTHSGIVKSVGFHWYPSGVSLRSDVIFMVSDLKLTFKVILGQN